MSYKIRKLQTIVNTATHESNNLLGFLEKKGFHGKKYRLSSKEREKLTLAQFHLKLAIELLTEIKGVEK